MPIFIFQFSLCIPSWELSNMCSVNLLLGPINAISFIIDGPHNTHFPLVPVAQDSKTAHKKSQTFKNSLNLKRNQVNH